MRRRVMAALALAVVALMAGAGVVALNLAGEDAVDGAAPGVAAAADSIARGAYLARAGNCISCHTVRGGTAYAGGRGIDTPFGTVYAPNLTPDADTGLGRWNASQFWRALHNGLSRDGRLLYPAFPYPNYTRVTRADSDALFDFLRSLQPVAQPNRPHTLRFPFDTQPALAVWRALYFRPGALPADPARSADWNRGAYLVQGLGHCNACHASRNALGASSTLDLGGGLIPVQNWYAPSLTDAHEAGVADWPIARVVQLLKTGVAEPDVSVIGPMGEVVRNSTQHLDDADLAAMAVYLKSLPAGGAAVAPKAVSRRDGAASVAAGSQPAADPAASPATVAATAPIASTPTFNTTAAVASTATYTATAPVASTPNFAATAPIASAAADASTAPIAAAGSRGARLYARHCAACHGDAGEGAPGAYPRLAGNRAVTLDPPANLVRIVLAGGFAPSTAGNPRPFGMPPFATVLNDDEVAAVTSHVRGAWGNRAPPVSLVEVQRYRGNLRE